MRSHHAIIQGHALTSANVGRVSQEHPQCILHPKSIKKELRLRTRVEQVRRLTTYTHVQIQVNV
eukprot:scaffold2601_cov154-Alexandrium_tamarense.AAC.6